MTRYYQHVYNCQNDSKHNGELHIFLLFKCFVKRSVNEPTKKVCGNKREHSLYLFVDKSKKISLQHVFADYLLSQVIRNPILLLFD